MKHPPVRLDGAMIDAAVATLGRCAAESDWCISACSVECTHCHLLLTFTQRDIDKTVKWIKDQATKAIHKETRHSGPVWTKGRWRSFIFDLEGWELAMMYIEEHNVRRGVGPRPYPFIVVE